MGGMVPGFYDVKAEKTGFKTVQSKHNEVVVNSSSLLNLTLSVGSAEETVQVSANAVSIDTESTAIDANLTDTFYKQSLPMPRDVSAIFSLAPGVRQQVAAWQPAAGRFESFHRRRRPALRTSTLWMA